MAETCIIRIRDLPTQALQKKVRGFLAGGSVSVEDDSGKTYEVAFHRNRVILRCDEDGHSVGYFGKGDTTGAFWDRFFFR